jgi:hypothetical protein
MYTFLLAPNKAASAKAERIRCNRLFDIIWQETESRLIKGRNEDTTRSKSWEKLCPEKGAWHSSVAGESESNAKANVSYRRIECSKRESSKSISQISGVDSQ